MTSRRLLTLAPPIALLLALAYWSLFSQDSIPARSTLAVDWERVRRLAGPAEAGTPTTVVGFLEVSVTVGRLGLTGPGGKQLEIKIQLDFGLFAHGTTSAQ